MSSSALERPTSTAQFAGDSLAWGLVAMLVSNVLQRGIGFLRGIGFCHFLPDAELGLWSLAQSFFIIAAPLAVLGLPGSFGRFVEHYRKRGELLNFLRRILSVCVVGTLALLISLVVFPQSLSDLIFGQPQSLNTVLLVAACLLSVIVFNTLTELAGSLRQVTLVSRMHLINSVSFTIFGIVILYLWRDWRAIVFGFLIASILGSLPSIRLRGAFAKTDAIHHHPISAGAMWSRLVPFAFAIWLSNLLSNMFDLVDRYMLLHLADESIRVGQALVGQYHSARILPMLLISLGTMLSGILFPYIVADWEAGRKKEAGERVLLSFKLVSFALWTGALGFALLAPWVFRSMLQNRYDDGLNAIPMAMVQTIWSCLFLTLQNYLWCAERGRIVVATNGVALVINVILNLCLIPSFGLNGAIFSTTIATGCGLFLLAWQTQRAGCRLNLSHVWTVILPASLLFGEIPSAVVGTLGVFMAGRTLWLFNAREKLLLEESFQQAISKLPVLKSRQNLSLWP